MWKVVVRADGVCYDKVVGRYMGGPLGPALDQVFRSTLSISYSFLFNVYSLLLVGRQLTIFVRTLVWQGWLHSLKLDTILVSGSITSIIALKEC